MPDQVMPVWATNCNIPKEVVQAIETLRRECKDEYALAYASEAAFREADHLGGRMGIKSQILYILSNTSGWRGETARQTKLVLNQWIKTVRR